MNQHTKELASGARFEFGKNWQRFLTVLNEERIKEAEKSLRDFLELEHLQGKTFLDVGSGSGLFSLAARRLGASVHSFDYDPQSVACTKELKRRYFPGDTHWKAEVGSVLDLKYLKSLGTFDIVYSWGVLHHTGNMYQALENVIACVREGGSLYIAIYNDQGGKSIRATWLKKSYVKAPLLGKWLILLVYSTSMVLLWLVYDLIRSRRNPMRRYTEYKKSRGMSRWHDIVDWVGGYPFEVASLDAIFDFYRKKEFILKRLRTCGGGCGNNEFVFLKEKKP